MLLVALATAAGAAFGCRDVQSEIDRPFDNLVLITIDTLRADHLGCYGYPRPVSPFIDSLAQRGVRFDQTIASSSHTAPSHASILTSQYPARHRVLRNGQRLRAGVPTLAGILRRQGFETAGFAAVGFLKTIARGFESWDSVRSRPYRNAEVMTDLAIAWSAQRDRERRFFTWVHFYDVHNSGTQFSIPEPHFTRMQEDSAARFEELSEFWVSEQGLPAAQLEEHRPRYDHYDAQIAYVDENLERLVASIEADHSGQRTLWVISADHGEGLGNHDFFGHGRFVYEEQVRVPMIFFGGSGWRQNEVVERMARHVDLLPTVAELLGVGLDIEGLAIEGRSLVPWLASRDAQPRIDVALSQRRVSDHRDPESDWRSELMLSARTERYKYILRNNEVDELYDLESDPFESTSLVGRGLDIERQLSTWLTGKYQWMLEHPLIRDPEDPAVEPEHVEELRALGYLN